MFPAFIVSTIILPLLASAIIVPTTPDSTGVYDSGSSCPIAWTQDTTGEWNNFTIWFMTGPNNPMVYLETVVAGLDGTSAGTSSFTWPCPTVSINAPIYFYQFQQNGVANLTWTTRFTIASATGATVPAPNATQPDGTDVPWGTGQLLGSANSTSPSTSSAAAGTPGASTSSSAAAATTPTSATASSPPAGTVIVTEGGSSATGSSTPAPSSKSGASLGMQVSSVLAVFGAFAVGVAGLF